MPKLTWAINKFVDHEKKCVIIKQMAIGAVARRGAQMALRQGARQAARSAATAARGAARNAMATSRRAATNAARQGVKNYARDGAKSAWKAAAKSAPGRAVGRTAGAARRVGARARPILTDIGQASQIAAAMAPYIADYGGTRGKQVATVLSDDTRYKVGGKSMSRKELLEELAKADKAMGAMEVNE